MKKFWVFVTRLHGWKLETPDLSQRPEVRHCVLAMAPHTCIEDFFVGAATLFATHDHQDRKAPRLNPHIFMKKEFFNWFTGPILRSLGVIAVDRGNRSNNLVAKAVEALNSNPNCMIVLTPEATRKPVKRFKRGFYEIATQANVPIVLGYIDFKHKVAGYGPTIHPSGDYDADFAKMIEFFGPIPPKFPKGWSWGEARS